MKYERVGWFVLGGFVSGVLSTLGQTYFIQGSFPAYQYLPGLIFGLIMATLISKLYHPLLRKLVSFVIFSTVGYFCAVICATIVLFSNLPALMGLSGLIGSIVMLLGFKLFCNFTPKEFFALVALGALLSYSVFVFHGYSPSREITLHLPYLSTWILFVSWQAAMATAMGYVIKRHQNR